MINNNITKEILSLEKFYIQKIFYTINQCFIFEIFSKNHKKQYLISSITNDFFIVLQNNKPQWDKISNSFLLIIKKYYLGSLVNIFINEDNYEQIILTNKTNSLLISNKPKNIFLFKEQNLISSYYKTDIPNINSKYIKYENNNFISNYSFAKIISEKYLDHQQAKIEALLKKQQKKQQILLANLESDLKKWQKNLELESLAELIKNNLHSINIKDKNINCVKYSENKIENIHINIPLNLNVLEYLDKIYKTVKKAKRAIPQIQMRIENERKNLTNMAMPSLTHEVVDKKNVVSKRLPFREFISSDKIKILIGKSAKDSDEMLRKYADGNDFWFHVKDATSAHAIVKYKGVDIPTSTLLEAAMLVFHFSKQTSQTIQYTKMKWVKKVKGAALGKVIVTQEKTIFITPDKDKINRLLSQITFK